MDLTDIDTIGISLNILTVGGFVEARVGSPEGNLLTTCKGNSYGRIKSRRTVWTGILTKAKVNKLGLNGLQTLYLVYKAPADEKIDQKIIATAASADVAIVFVGTDEKTATEEADRLSLVLPGNQEDLIKAVAAVNPNTIVVMQHWDAWKLKNLKISRTSPELSGSDTTVRLRVMPLPASSSVMRIQEENSMLPGINP